MKPRHFFVVSVLGKFPKGVFLKAKTHFKRFKPVFPISPFVKGPFHASPITMHQSQQRNLTRMLKAKARVRLMNQARSPMRRKL